MKRSWLTILIILTVATLGLLEATLLRKETLSGGILSTFFYPHFAALGEQLASGALPRWNPYLGNGGSFFGPRAGGVVYPGNLLFAFIPLGRAMALFVALHILVATEGARRLSGRSAGSRVALASGLAYGLGGFVVSMIGNPVFLVSAAWLPWAALGGATTPRRPLLGVALAGTAIGLCFLAGEPQGALIAALAAAGLALGMAPASGRRRALAFAVLAVALGTAAGELTVASTLTILPETDRALSHWTDSEFGLAPIPTLIDLCVPGAMGLHADDTGGYWGSRLGASNLWCVLSFGTLGLAAAVAAVHRGCRARPAALALVFTGVVLAGLDAGSLLNLRFPSKWLVLAALGCALLVGPGLRILARGESRWGVGVLGVSVIAGIGGGAVLLLWSSAGPWFEAGDAERVVGSVARLTAAGALLRAGVVGALGLLLLHRRPRGRLGTALLLGLLVFDLLTVAKPFVRTTPTGLLDPPPLAARLAVEATGPLVRFDPRGAHLAREYRLPPEVEPLVTTRLELSDLFYRDVLWTNRGALHGVRSVQAFETAQPRARTVLFADPGYAALSLPERAARLDTELLLIDTLELQTLGSEGRAQLELLQAASPSLRQVVLARNLACPPWARLAGGQTHALTLEEAARAVCESSGLVLGPELPKGAGQRAGAGHVELAEPFAPERLVFTVNADAASWLVVRETYSPDWQATVDGRPTPIARADLLFRAVPVDAGKHTVVMTYAPAWWTAGLVSTLLGWAALLACLVFGLRRR